MEKNLQSEKFSLFLLDTPWVVAVQWTPVTNLPPAVHLDLRISPRIIEKMRNEPSIISGAWGKMVHEKNLKQKILCPCSFKRAVMCRHCYLGISFFKGEFLAGIIAYVNV